MLYSIAAHRKQILWAAFFICVWNLVTTDLRDLVDINHECKRDLRGSLALRKNPLNPFNLCSDNITKWKIYDVPENWEFRERFFFMPIYAILRALSFLLLRFLFLWKISRTDFLVIVKIFLDDLYEEILFREKRSESSKLFFRNLIYFLGTKLSQVWSS